MQGLPDEVLYKNLLDLGLVEQSILDGALAQAKNEGKNLSQVLIERSLVTDEQISRVVSELTSIPFIRLSQVAIPDNVLQIVPELIARRQKVIAFSLENGVLKLAMADPKNREISDLIGQKTGLKVESYYATDGEIEFALGKYKKDLQRSFDELLSSKMEEAKKLGSTKDDKQAEAPVTELVNLLIEYAYGNRASDIHIEPKKNAESLVRFRIDGVLHSVLHLPRSIHERVISRIKVASRLKTDEHFSAQDGKMQLTLPEEELDVRVSIVPITSGEKAVLRLLSSKSRQFTLSDLGMRDLDLTKVRDGFNKPYGMVLSTGPTGSGKTTSIYAILKILNVSDVNIATIEDPVEYDIGGLNQIQVNPKTNLNFANGLRAILRQDPNVIFVGEIRDSETAGIAVNSAMTGHLVLSTLHTNDAATALPRLLDMGIEPYLVASTVNVIVAQRLVRKVCESCRYSYVIKTTDLKKNIPSEIVSKQFGERQEVNVYRGKGCAVCGGTGYIGRIGIFEVLVMEDEIRQLVSAKAIATDINKKAKELGMITMLEDGLKKASAGITTIEEILRATKE